ncbi:hypothetical protein E8E13_010852 [Curvularia kusanoi]|uniref:Uncharacterized protein n=1 Tax=Curvularia kusanoi TaxID=90978 RepID=A0A9P4TNZ1_CURKU|nr:hypothetical protein E8E13_010852 [Curvularia kusanoi]
MTPPAYGGAKALGFSKYAPQLAAKPSVAESTIATKEQIAALNAPHEAKPPAAALAIEQGVTLKQEVDDHTASFSRAVSNAVLNTRELLCLLRESTPGSENADKLWQELEQLFKAANDANDALPRFLEKQRDSMSLYHSSMLNETRRETQEELNLQHKKVNTQHNLILEQQEAFQDHKMQTASKLEELAQLQERVSRLTLEKGNFRTEVDKYKALLENETASKAEDVKTADALHKELETLISSKKQLEAENDMLRKTTADMLEQIKNAEQKVTDRFSKELAAKSEELQKLSVKAASLNSLMNTLKSDETTAKKELEKLKNENRLISVKYTNQAAEQASAQAKLVDQGKKIESLTADINKLQKSNADLQRNVEKASELTQTNNDLSKAKDDLQKRLASLDTELRVAKDNAMTAQNEVQTLKIEAAKATATGSNNDKALMERIHDLEEKKGDLESALAEWTQLANRSYAEYQKLLPLYKDTEKYRNDASDKEVQIKELKRLLAAKDAQSNGAGAGASAGDDAVYWKNKYNVLLSSI